MSLEIGRKLGPYEIVASLGAGGMGEVYRARDTRLERDVAIKVLPEHLAGNETARLRLEREAKSVSGLSHPHICTLFDVGHEGDLYFLVIEYLEGETLGQRLERGPLSTDEVMKYAIQIADALDKAHRQGVIHRDLKPGNVMITAQGAKLLDFGLAKTVEGQGGDGSLTVAPTATSPLTAQGTIVGTFQYMAPEQLEGLEAGARSDIFAFGSVLFEMITGRRAFEGKTQAGLIAAIIEREPPDVSSLQPLAPPALDRLIRTCLVKDPEERRQSMHDVLLDLRWIAEAGSQAGVPVPVTRRRRHRVQLAWAVATVLALTSLTMAWALWMRSVEQPRRIVSSLVPPQGIFPLDRGLGISPDGRYVVSVAREGEGVPVLRLTELDRGIDRILPGTERSWGPFWSPDSRSVAFFVEGELRRIHVSGGTPITICQTASGSGGSWNADGVIVFASFQSGLKRVPASGGESVELVAAGEQGRFMPVFLPDGNRFLYLRSGDSGESATVVVGSLDGSTDHDLIQSSLHAGFSGGHLIYGNDATLIAQPFDPRLLEMSGDPRVLAEPVADYAVNDRGMLVYVEEGVDAGSQLVGYDREGQTQISVFSPVRLDDLAISPDGKQLAMMRLDPDQRNDYDVWTYDLKREVFTRVTFDKEADDPVWSPDGQWLIYSRNPQFYRIRASGAGQPELVRDSNVDEVCHDWSRDGKQVLFSRWGAETELDLWTLTIGDDASTAPVLSGAFDEFQAEFSPDGRWLAYASDESGQLQVHVMNWPELTEKWQVSTRGGGMPRWRGDGRELFYVSGDRELTAVAIDTSGSEFTVGEETKLFTTRISPGSRSTDYVVTPDGERFLFIERPVGADSDPETMTLVQEFLALPEGS
jgi:Tol biopolymer transport system component